MLAQSQAARAEEEEVMKAAMAAKAAERKVAADAQAAKVIYVQNTRKQIPAEISAYSMLYSVA